MREGKFQPRVGGTRAAELSQGHVPETQERQPTYLSKEELSAQLFDREMPKEYERIIRSFRGFIESNMFTPLRGTQGLWIPDQQKEEFIRQKIQGKMVMDLGCGAHIDSREALQKFQPKTYVGVDLQTFLFHSDPGEIDGVETFYFGEQEMLTFLSKLKDEASDVHFFSAIEALEYDLNTQAYLTALATELARTLTVGGIVIFSNQTDDAFAMTGGPEKYGMKKFESSTPNRRGPSIGVYIKNSLDSR